MWTPTTRREHSRDHLRYGSDLTDAEWEIIAPFLPPPRRTGRPRRWPMREVVNAIFYVLRAGCPWRMLPDSFAPVSTVYRWFVRLRDSAAVVNRVPKLDGDAVAGGLAVGLKAVLEGHGGTWIGWSGRLDSDAERAECRVERTSPFILATTDLTDAEHARYYEGFCNRTLWPLLHGLTDFVRFDPEDLAAYRAVNARFARHVVRLAREEDLVWIHDYHLMLLGRDLRRAGVESRLGFFLHVPFPRPGAVRRLPCHAELVEALTEFDLLGFQTPADAQNFRAYVLQYLGAVAVDDGSLLLRGRRIRVGAFPIGIDTAGFERLAQSAPVARAMEEYGPCFAGRLGIVGADRLDYTKGIPERLRGFERLLETSAEYRRKAFLVQIAAPSRESVPEYAALKSELDEEAGRINAGHGDVDWTPVRFLNRTFDHTRLTALYRLSRVGLITPLRDGMNMVAKEYVAAQNPTDPGVLVLSRFAGAAVQMTDALLVDPGDADGVAQALRQALDMPLDERRDRWNALIAGLRREDIHNWSRCFLDALGSIVRHCDPGAEEARAGNDHAFKRELVDALKPLRAFTQDEAAEICGCRPGTIKSRVHRAREALARMLHLERPRPHSHPQERQQPGLGSPSPKWALANQWQ